MRCLIIVAIIVNIGWTQAISGKDSTGNFDIEKVRAAALGNDTISASTGLPAAEKDPIAKILVRITLYLGMVIVLIFGGAFLFRKNARSALHGGSGAMDIIETLPLGQNRMLIMVRVMDAIYLVSHTASSVALIEKIEGQKALDIISASRGGGTMVQFREVFHSFMGKMKKPS